MHAIDSLAFFLFHPYFCLAFLLPLGQLHELKRSFLEYYSSLQYRGYPLFSTEGLCSRMTVAETLCMAFALFFSH